jgi:glycosyltransferase involved in cell wall biosynthesis
VPVYNIKKYLCDCVDSILRQTYPNIEIILVDDGSTDGSGLLCDELESDNYKVDIIENLKMMEKVVYERNGYLWNKIFKRDIIGTTRFAKELDYMEDELFVLQYLTRISKVAYTDEPLYMHRDNPDSIMNVVLSEKKLTLMVADERIYDLLVDNNISSTLQRKVWNDLIKAYAISIKKVMLSGDKTFHHWKQYIKDGYNKYKSRNEIDNSWNIKEKVYLVFLRLYALT